MRELKGQGSIEYLLMIAGALILVAVVIHYLTGTVSTVSSGSKVRIAYVVYNQPGDDVPDEGGGEYVEIRNNGPFDVDMTGWKLMDEGHHEYHFPDGFILKSGSSVRV
jgi:hypothetical protein